MSFRLNQKFITITMLLINTKRKTRRNSTNSSFSVKDSDMISNHFIRYKVPQSFIINL